jgi:branched-subunit amino acid transport protein
MNCSYFIYWVLVVKAYMNRKFESDFNFSKSLGVISLQMMKYIPIYLIFIFIIPKVLCENDVSIKFW